MTSYIGVVGVLESKNKKNRNRIFFDVDERCRIYEKKKNMTELIVNFIGKMVKTIKKFWLDVKDI